MFKCLRFIGILIFLYNPLISAQSVEYWDGHPIHISLKPLQESLLRLPSRAEVKFPLDLKNKLILINNNQSLLLKSLEVFDETLIQITLLNSDHDVLLVELVSTLEGRSEDCVIQLKTTDSILTNADEVLSDAELARSILDLMQGSRVNPLENLNIKRSPMHTLNRVPLYSNPSIGFMPIAMWTDQGRYATLILASNQSGKPVTIDPILLKGEWSGVFFENGFMDHPVELGSVFSKTDRLYFVLIANKPFSEVHLI